MDAQLDLALRIWLIPTNSSFMSKADNYFTNEPKQDRSQVRVEKILDAVEELIQETPTKKIDVKSIAQKAFISVGAIYHHFPSLNSIFASLLIRKVKLRLAELAKLIDTLGPDVKLEQFADQLIDQAFFEWGNRPIAAKKEALEFYYQHTHNPEFFYSYAHILYPHVQAFIARNTTNTIREITEEEWPFFNRVSQTAIIGPFLEQLPIAGTPLHRSIVKDIVLRVYSK